MARECPNKKDGDSGDTSWKKGKNAVKRFKARECKANMQAKRMKKPPPPSMEDDGRWVRLNSVLEVPYCPDTGADQNIIPQAIVDELQALQPQLQVLKLAAPFVGTACNQMPFEASSYVDLTLRIQTAAGPVKVPGKRRCYVVNDGDEFLVSNHTLKTIGIDIDRLLEQVARLQVDEDGDDLEEVGGDCEELPQRSAVRTATMKAALPVAKNEVEGALHGMIDGAVDNGFPMEHVKYLWDVLSKHDIWRIKFDGSDPPAKVKPLKVTPKDGKHNLLEERFLKLFAQELLDAGVIKSNQQSEWCSPVNPVLKPDGSKSLKSADKWSDDDVLKNYRLTNDYRVVNSLTELKAGTMPFQATILQNLRGKKAMGVFDLPKCFWQFPLHPDSWDMLSFMLNGCVYTPDRVMQGHVDSALYVQSTNEECYKDLLYKNMLIWIDDIFVYADTVEEYVDALESYFDRVAQYGFELSPSKTKLFTDQVKWCGRIISGDSVKQDPERIEHLCKGKKKRIASGVQLELTDGEKLAFDAVKSKLRSSVELSHPRDDATMCFFTDASDHGWSIVKAWSVIEKEAYPIARACEKLNYMLMRPTGFKMYCDHNNLIHVFAPGEEWKAHTRGKLMRWAAIIGGYRYEIIHIDGIHNLWADMMSRWGQPTPSLATKRVKIRRGHGWSKKVKTKVPPPEQPKLRPLDKDFVWPCVVDICHAQDQHGNDKPKRATVVDGLCQVDERLWIPSAANDLIQRIMKAWSVIEKEAYPIARACEKLNYMLMRPTGFKMYCDHNNLIHVFAPGEEWKAHTRGKLMRWAAIIGGYRYEIIHIDGIHNLWADMMSRWGQPTPSLATKRVKIRRGHGWSKKVKTKVPPPEQPKLRPLDKDFVWPCVVDICHAQDQHGNDKPKRATVVDGLCQVDERLWIPSAANDLIQRIMVAAHCGSAGHRGHAALVATIRRQFYVDHLADRASEFLRGCLLCPRVKGGRVVHQPYAPRRHAKERNEGIHFDYLYMGEAFSGAKYVLVLKDDLTHYCELIACDGPTSQVCVDALVDWTKRFGMPRVWVSDQGTHFKNVAMKALAHKFKVHHDLTLAYCPWRNGTVERMNRDILQVMRVMLREYQLAEQEWGYLLPVVQANLNQTPAASLASKSPMELLTALNPATPLDVVVVGMNKELRESDWTVKDIPKNLDMLRASLQVMHKEVLDKNAMRAAKATKATEKYEQCNVSEGDYVLWSRLLVTWTGPYRVKEVGEFSVVLEHLVTHELREAHASRVKLYAEDSFEVTEEILEHISEQGIMLKVKSIAGHKFVPDVKVFMLEVLWEGFEDIESSWEPLQKLIHECPAVVKNYVEGVKTASEGDALRKAMKRAKAKN
ncbi:hypothetical protein H257_06962 [Aphanomyces astaci]|uniref:Reverse transcriptase n=1 Tax=Aphanomyces astaci TaxID=112090 RepID=W4GJ50_APHAT|nr:hypothetical protein H257_06962 [Aphanomyces astaci]ETV79725.1 hypothetical protein H257_06962 [Aphanomyces astaci]|eukprot:XP_009830661.1 hypothetical protein H257_06962 [Aphanomyces astaci]